MYSLVVDLLRIHEISTRLVELFYPTKDLSKFLSVSPLSSRMVSSPCQTSVLRIVRPQYVSQSDSSRNKNQDAEQRPSLSDYFSQFTSLVEMVVDHYSLSLSLQHPSLRILIFFFWILLGVITIQFLYPDGNLYGYQIIFGPF